MYGVSDNGFCTLRRFVPYFWVVGYAFVAALRTQRDLIRNALIAPGVALALGSICLRRRSRCPAFLKTEIRSMSGACRILREE
jgi:hypothetical protein